MEGGKRAGENKIADSLFLCFFHAGCEVAFDCAFG